MWTLFSQKAGELESEDTKVHLLPSTGAPRPMVANLFLAGLLTYGSLPTLFTFPVPQWRRYEVTHRLQLRGQLQN